MAQSKLNTTLAHYNQSCTLHDLQLIVTVHLIIQQLVYHANQRFFSLQKVYRQNYYCTETHKVWFLCRHIRAVRLDAQILASLLRLTHFQT